MISGGALSMYFSLHPDIIWGPEHPLYGNLLYFRAGVVLEVLFFSMGLGYKHKLDEKNKVILETQLQSKREELKLANELDELKSKLFANISHEFRTPLTLIMGPLKQMLSRQQLDIHGLTAAVNNSERLHRLISQLLDLSRFDAGKMTLENTTSDFLAFLRRVTSSFCALAETKRIMFCQAFPSGCVFANFDHDKIEKILYNVLSNAFKFTPSGGEVNFTVTERTSLIWEIVIADNGKGIPSADLKHIFERFNRSWAQGLYQYEGSGIGLALTHELIKILGGQISVQSEPEKGSVFTILLPIEKSTDSGKVTLPDIDYSITNNKHSEEDVQEEDLPLSRQSVLIVEDNAELLHYIGACLKNQYHILEAGNGRQGLGISLNEVPDLIISDLMMPEMDGIEFCRGNS